MKKSFNTQELLYSKSKHHELSKDTKGTFQFLQNFQLQFNLIFNEEIIQYSKTFVQQVQTSWAFQRHQRDIQFLQNFQLQFNLTFNEEIIQYSRTFVQQVQTSWAFQRHQEHDDLKHPSSMDLISTKQNKTDYLPS